MVFKVFQRVTRGNGTPESVARRATNEELFGPSSEDLQILTSFTKKPKSCAKVFDVVEHRINQDNRHWRQKSKTLTVLQYFLIHGSPECFRWMQENRNIIEKLREFKYLDSKNNDQGRSIREKACALLQVIEDPSRLEEARENYRRQREDVRKSIGTGRTSTTSRGTLEAVRDGLFEDPDPGDLKHVFRVSSPPPTTLRGDAMYTPDESNISGVGLCSIEEEH